MTASMSAGGINGSGRLRFLHVSIVMGLLGLPLAAWLDLQDLSGRILGEQARETGRIIDQMRNFYASDVVKAISTATEKVIATHDYKHQANAIPIPATLSLELGDRISIANGVVTYRFISDFPFAGRQPHELDGFERKALADLRANPADPLVNVSGLLNRQVRIASPIRMEEACVGCHNQHPASPKRDWKVGDVRGIQEIIVRQPIIANLLSFKYMIAYFFLSATLGLMIIRHQQKQASLIEGMNVSLLNSQASVMDSINYAGRIQRALLPNPARLKDRFTAFEVIWEPKDVVGGDIYWVSPEGDKLPYVGLIDCTGHGVPGALMTMLVGPTLERLLASTPELSPGAALASLDEAVRKLLHQDEDQSGTEDGFDAALCHIDVPRRQLTFAGAHLSMIHVPKSGPTTCYPGERIPLGYPSKSHRNTLAEHRISYAPGDRFILLTDGVSDQIGGPNGRAFGMAGVMSTVEASRHQDATALKSSLKAKFDTWQGTEERRDDITLMIFEPAG